jgi:predicted phage terminase large subunit-like protein
MPRTLQAEVPVIADREEDLVPVVRGINTMLDPIDKALAIVSLSHFVRLFWNVVEKREYVPGWHIEGMCDHLQAVSAGKILRLLINIPPRHSKSLIVSVLWPIWDWLQHPDRQFLYASYAQGLSTRDAVKARRLFNSPLFQDLLYEVHPELVLTGDQNTKTRYENNQNGYRLATSVDGALTGEGGDIIVIDDPHNIRQGESETTREACLSWWDEAMSTRLNDMKTGAYVIIMQRVHEHDLSGHILEREPEEWDHLCFPARYEAKSRVKSSLGFKDPRRREGTPLCPARFGEPELAKLERSLGTYGTAGQLQQRPSPRGGGMMKVAELKVIQAINRAHIAKSIRYWDKAGSENKGARSAGLLMHEMKEGPFEFVIEDVVKGQWSYAQREKRILQVAEFDKAATHGAGAKYAVEIWTEQEPGSGGKESAERTIKMLKGYPAFKELPTGDKLTRAQPLSAQVEIGNVAMLMGPWVKDFVDEMEAFGPGAGFKDQVDAASGAFNKLNNLDGKSNEGGTW